MLRTTDSLGHNVNTLFKQMPDVTLEAIMLEDNSPLIGKNLKETALRQRYNLTVVAIQQGSLIEPIADAHYIFAKNDILSLFGKAKTIRETRTHLVNGSE